jgi:hypothetical protein
VRYYLIVRAAGDSPSVRTIICYSSYGELTVLDPLIVGEDFKKKITFGNIGQNSSLLVSDMGLTDQPAIHIEKEQLINLTVFSIRGKEQHLLPRIRVKPDLVLLAALRLIDLDTMDSIVTRTWESGMPAGWVGAGGKGGTLNA